jgi:hypothetical protein
MTVEKRKDMNIREEPGGKDIDMASYTDFQPVYGWVVKDTFVLYLTKDDLLQFEGSGTSADSKSRLTANGMPLGSSCNYIALDTVTVDHGTKPITYTIRRYLTAPLKSIACFPPGVTPLAYWPQDGVWGPATGATWTAQEGGAGGIYPWPAESEPES